ncbi:hypothetical protein PMAYCL1PPCAC_21937, partial [Pristionchus mayeri]
ISDPGEPSSVPHGESSIQVPGEPSKEPFGESPETISMQKPGEPSVMAPNDNSVPAPARENPEATDKLLLIHVLTRHGDRASTGDTYITPEAEEVFYRGPGHLTDMGAEHAKQMGAAYRARYIDGYQLFNGR